MAITSPSNNGAVKKGTNITISATAASTTGTVSKVEFYQGTTKLGEDTTSPYTYTWVDAPVGTYSLTAKATDSEALVATSTAVSISVNSDTNTAPTATITSPSNNATFTVGGGITITANATDTNGSITKVEFFQGATKLGEDTTSPYSFAWTGATAGTYTLTVKATDNAAAVATSAPVTIKVNATPVAGAITVDAGNDESLTLPENSATLTASANPNTGITYTWTQIDGPNKASISKAAESTTDVSDLVEGTYVFEVSIVDGTGRTATDQVNVVVYPSTSTEVTAGIPRFFSPNNDGVGDMWVWPDADAYQNLAVTVYNRSGQKVYEAFPYQSNWDGRVDGRPLSDGDYYYIAKGENQATISGAVRIIR